VIARTDLDLSHLSKAHAHPDNRGRGWRGAD
jgi:hypothetical protein